MGDGEVHVKLGLEVLLYIENYFLRSDGVGCVSICTLWMSYGLQCLFYC